MKKKYFLLKILVTYFFLTTSVFSSKSNFFIEGKALFEKKEFDKSKIFFEKDIVFNPTSEKSYLYLAKIFNEKKNDQEEEMNLNNVLLLNPKNDEAIYMLTLLRIKQSNYHEAKELIKKFPDEIFVPKNVSEPIFNQLFNNILSALSKKVKKKVI